MVELNIYFNAIERGRDTELYLLMCSYCSDTFGLCVFYIQPNQKIHNQNKNEFLLTYLYKNTLSCLSIKLILIITFKLIQISAEALNKYVQGADTLKYQKGMIFKAPFYEPNLKKINIGFFLCMSPITQKCLD